MFTIDDAARKRLLQDALVEFLLDAPVGQPGAASAAQATPASARSAPAPSNERARASAA